MTDFERLEALNPVPEYRGNPGPAQNQRPSRLRRGARAAAVLGVAASLIALGAFFVDRSDPDPIDIDVAGQPESTDIPAPATTEPDATPVPIPNQTTAGAAQVAELAPFASPTALDNTDTPPRLIAKLEIPVIDVESGVLEGVSSDVLRLGPGHYPGTPLPGQAGNVAIAGRAATPGAPLHRVEELRSGDEIIVTTLQGRHQYEVRELLVVEANDVTVLNNFGDNRLTLTTTRLENTLSERLVVVAFLVSEIVPTVAFDPLPVFVDTTDFGALDAPRIDSIAFQQRQHQPYFSFVGSDHALDTAETFLATQFPEWSKQVVVGLYEHTERAASVRWTDAAHGTSGWIVLFFGDGAFHVFDMTTDGLAVDFFPSALGATGAAQSVSPVQLEVWRPVPHTMTPDRPVQGTSELVLEPLVVANVGATGADQFVRLDFSGGRSTEDNFQEVRVFVRNDSGEQVGGALSSISVISPVESLAVITPVDQRRALDAILAANQGVVLDAVTFDRWQSVETIELLAPELLRPLIELPEHELTTIVPFESALISDQQREQFMAELETLALVIEPLATIRSSDPVIRGPRPDRYVVNELPAAAQCAVVGQGGANTVVTINESRRTFPTPADALASTFDSVDGEFVEFVDSDGVTLGFARAFPDRPLTFGLVVTVSQAPDEQAPNSWVLDRSEQTGC